MLVRVLVACLLVALAGCTSDGGAEVRRTEPMTHDVAIQGFAFSPKTLDILVGDTVRWTNLDSATHTITEEAYTFEAGELAPGEAFVFLFEETGRFGYRCDIHPSMTGWIVVT